MRLVAGLALVDWPRAGTAQGRWYVLASAGDALGQVNYPAALTVDGVGNLYLADTGNNRVMEYTPGP